MEQVLYRLAEHLMDEALWEKRFSALTPRRRVDALLKLPHDVCLTGSQAARLYGVEQDEIWDICFRHSWEMEDRGTVIADSQSAAGLLGSERQQAECMTDQLTLGSITIDHPGALFLPKPALMLLGLYLALDTQALTPRLLLDQLLLQAGYTRQDQLMLGVARAALDDDSAALTRAKAAFRRFVS